jgi:uncharacterized membrane protein YecN with MAPEG domain
LQFSVTPDKKTGMPVFFPIKENLMITSLYAALLTLLFVFLTVRTVSLRNKFRISIGDGSQPLLLRATRAHANFAEYVPLALLLIFFVEMHGAMAWLVHALGLALLVGRSLHAFGISQMAGKLQFRIMGMVLTLTSLVASTLSLLWLFAYK